MAVTRPAAPDWQDQADVARHGRTDHPKARPAVPAAPPEPPAPVPGPDEPAPRPDPADAEAELPASDGPQALALPPLVTLAEARPDRAFRVAALRAALWYQPGGEVLIVSLDNLATVEEPLPRPAWLAHRLLPLGYSVLGVQSMAKDWFRNPDAAPLIEGLAAQGFFAGFERVIFLGASMGGFGAINLASLVPGAAVIALSPQSTMNRAIVPFEARFGWAVKNSDWTTPRFLDAAEAAPGLARLVLLYDPRVPEDRLHADRLAGPVTERLRVAHATHEAVRVLLKCGALPPLLADVAAGRPVGTGFWQAMRARRTVRKWSRQFMSEVARRRTPREVIAVADRLLEIDRYRFATEAKAVALAKLGDGGGAR